MKELPLIIFTLAMQAAIGACLWAVFIRLKDKDAPVFKTNTLVALVLGAVGMLASLIHLGKPLLALSSMANIFNSWLSREIFFSGGFFVLLVIVWLLERKGKASSLFSGLACIAGLASVFAMAQLYMDTIIPAWQGVNTLVEFYATTIILGAVVFYLTVGKEAREKLLRLDFVVLAAVLVQAAFLPNYMASMAASAGAGQASAALLAGSYGVVTFLRWVLVLGGIFLFVLSRTSKSFGQAGIIYLAITVLVVGEILGRYLFYIAGIPIGIG